MNSKIEQLLKLRESWIDLHRRLRATIAIDLIYDREFNAIYSTLTDAEKDEYWNSPCFKNIANKEYYRPKTRGELRDKIREGIKCEVVADNESTTSMLLDGWLDFKGKYKTYPSENKGWIVYENIENNS
jgi:hypothetical protein